MRFINYTLVFCLLVMTMSGCYNRINKTYGYNKAQAKFGKVVLSSKLIGSFKDKGNVTVQGNPYELIVNAECSGDNCKVLNIVDVKVTGVNTGVIMYYNSKSTNIPFERYSDGRLNAQLSIKDLNIEYEDLILEFKVSLDSESSAVMRLNLNKSYKEHKSNDFLDKLMSV